VYWIKTYGGQLLNGPKLAKSCSVYQEEEKRLLPEIYHLFSPGSTITALRPATNKLRHMFHNNYAPLLINDGPG
jgi:hypothetical protein